MEHYVGRVGLVDGVGAVYSVEALLSWAADDSEEWTGSLVGPLDWERLAGEQLTLELPGKRWWDLPLFSNIRIVKVLDGRVEVEGRFGARGEASAADDRDDRDGRAAGTRTRDLRSPSTS